MSTTIKSDSVDFACYHSLMILILLIFFGILILPCYLKKINHGSYREVDATVIHVYYNQPDLSYVQLEIESDGTKKKFKELVAQKINKNDILAVYIDKKKNEILLQRPNQIIYIVLLIAYILIFLFTIYTVYDVWINRLHRS